MPSEADIIAIIRDELDWPAERDPDEATGDALTRIAQRINREVIGERFTAADFKAARRDWRNTSGVIATTGALNAFFDWIMAHAAARREGRRLSRPPCPERDAVLARGRNVAPQQDGATT